MGVFDVFQIPYSALQREHEELIVAAAAGGRRGAHPRRRRARRGCRGQELEPCSRSVPRRAAQDRWEAADLDELLDTV